MQDEGGGIHECRAAGRFRKEGTKPLVGDYVTFDPQTPTATGSIRDIRQRSSVLVRPPVANVDLQVIVASPKQPAVDLLLVDKLILQARAQNIEPVLCINKADAFPQEAEALAKSFSGACRTLCVSAAQGEGLEALEDAISGHTVCFAGQSAVGKSTLLNQLCGEKQQTGGLSAKTERGKHTTRTAELFYSPAANAYIMDTPGFSVFDSVQIERRELAEYCADFVPYLGKFRFSSCMHINEPDCAVKEAVAQGHIDEGRYQRYLELVQEKENKTW